MELSVRELIDGHSARLRYVYRYSTARVGHPETVAEHSFYVSFYCLLIGRWVNANAKPPGGVLAGIDIEKLLTRALLHDLEEARSGDFPRNFKHSDEKLRKMLEEASRIAFGQITKALLGTSKLVDDLNDTWEHSKDDTCEGAIVEFADFLAVLGFMMQENAAGGNHLVQRHVADMDKYFGKFGQPKYAFLAPLIKQTSELMSEIF